ncbi:Protein kinase-like protein [Penicillium pulvis]|uniref:Protein kinase-like protein n=1 Tax=Penicillium pulvis TaxID=1562058 RepID=UPI00254834D5|nr:Protein kinase-like protein [Penicillium pulvis]KAJ5802725.1 Protein kinase-like protein [Penicillium pulvis]
MHQASTSTANHPPDHVVYTLEGTINDFFASHISIRRQECDEFAASLYGDPVNAMPIQGCFSYTVIAGHKQSKIVQFRAVDSDIDMNILFFAAAWKARQVIGPYAAQGIHANYQERFKLLSQVLPSRYQQNLEMVRRGLSLLFMPTYPMVLSHGDLPGTNVLVDPSTGHLTGVIDWAEAQICPLGMSQWGLENILGTMDSTGWHYHPDHEALRILFWKRFEEAVGGVSKSDKTTIKVARMAGLFLRYGFNWQIGGRNLVDDGTSSFKYLDAFCATWS